MHQFNFIRTILNFSQSYTVTKERTVGFVKGREVPNKVITIELDMSLQPKSSEMIAMFKSGDWDSADYIGFSYPASSLPFKKDIIEDTQFGTLKCVEIERWNDYDVYITGWQRLSSYEPINYFEKIIAETITDTILVNNIKVENINLDFLDNMITDETKSSEISSFFTGTLTQKVEILVGEINLGFLDDMISNETVEEIVTAEIEKNYIDTILVSDVKASISNLDFLDSMIINEVINEIVTICTVKSVTETILVSDIKATAPSLSFLDTFISNEVVTEIII